MAEAYSNAIATAFGDLCKTAWLTGSFAYGGGTLGKSDVDVTIVLHNSALDVDAGRLNDRAQSFVSSYLALHRELGYRPDLHFPGEYVTCAMISDAVDGRGFHVDAAGKLFLPKASTQYYLEDPERWFRAWLSQTAFSRFLCGDRSFHRESKLGAWATIIRFLLRDKSDAFTTAFIFDSLRVFGVHHDYWSFRRLEAPWVNRVLTGLVECGDLQSQNNEFEPNVPALVGWEASLSATIVSGAIRRARLLLPMDMTRDIASFAENNWAASNEGLVGSSP